MDADGGVAVVLRGFSAGVQGLACVVKALPVNSTSLDDAEQGLMEHNGG